MVAIILLVVLAVILLLPYLRVDKYEEIKRQQSMRRAATRVQEKQRHFST